MTLGHMRRLEKVVTMAEYELVRLKDDLKLTHEVLPQNKPNHTSPETPELLKKLPYLETMFKRAVKNFNKDSTSTLTGASSEEYLKTISERTEVELPSDSLVFNVNVQPLCKKFAPQCSPKESSKCYPTTSCCAASQNFQCKSPKDFLIPAQMTCKSNKIIKYVPPKRKPTLLRSKVVVKPKPELVKSRTTAVRSRPEPVRSRLENVNPRPEPERARPPPERARPPPERARIEHERAMTEKAKPERAKTEKAKPEPARARPEHVKVKAEPKPKVSKPEVVITKPESLKSVTQESPPFPTKKSPPPLPDPSTSTHYAMIPPPAKSLPPPKQESPNIKQIELRRQISEILQPRPTASTRCPPKFPPCSKCFIPQAPFFCSTGRVPMCDTLKRFKCRGPPCMSSIISNCNVTSSYCCQAKSNAKACNCCPVKTFCNSNSSRCDPCPANRSTNASLESKNMLDVAKKALKNIQSLNVTDSCNHLQFKCSNDAVVKQSKVEIFISNNNCNCLRHNEASIKRTLPSCGRCAQCGNANESKKCPTLQPVCNPVVSLATSPKTGQDFGSSTCNELRDERRKQILSKCKEQTLPGVSIERSLVLEKVLNLDLFNYDNGNVDSNTFFEKYAKNYDKEVLDNSSIPQKYDSSCKYRHNKESTLKKFSKNRKEDYTGELELNSYFCEKIKLNKTDVQYFECPPGNCRGQQTIVSTSHAASSPIQLQKCDICVQHEPTKPQSTKTILTTDIPPNKELARYYSEHSNQNMLTTILDTRDLESTTTSDTLCVCKEQATNVNPLGCKCSTDGTQFEEGTKQKSLNCKCYVPSIEPKQPTLLDDTSCDGCVQLVDKQTPQSEVLMSKKNTAKPSKSQKPETYENKCKRVQRNDRKEASNNETKSDSSIFCRVSKNSDENCVLKDCPVSSKKAQTKVSNIDNCTSVKAKYLQQKTRDSCGLRDCPKFAKRAQPEVCDVDCGSPLKDKYLKEKTIEENCGLRDCPISSKREQTEVSSVDYSLPLKDKYLSEKTSDERCGLKDCPKSSKKAEPEVSNVDNGSSRKDKHRQDKICEEICGLNDCPISSKIAEPEVGNVVSSSPPKDKYLEEETSEENCVPKNCPKSSMRAQPKVRSVDYGSSRKDKYLEEESSEENCVPKNCPKSSTRAQPRVRSVDYDSSRKDKYIEEETSEENCVPKNCPKSSKRAQPEVSKIDNRTSRKDKFLEEEFSEESCGFRDCPKSSKRPPPEVCNVDCGSPRKDKYPKQKTSEENCDLKDCSKSSKKSQPEVATIDNRTSRKDKYLEEETSEESCGFRDCPKSSKKAQPEDCNIDCGAPRKNKYLKEKTSEEICDLKDCPKAPKRAQPELRKIDDSKVSIDKYAMKAQSDDYYPDDYKNLKPRISDENCDLKDCPKGSKKAPPEIRPVDDSEYCRNRKALKECHNDDCRLPKDNNASKSQQQRYIDDGKNIEQKISDENCNLRDCPKSSKKAKPEVSNVDYGATRKDKYLKEKTSEDDCGLRDCPKALKKAQPELRKIDDSKVSIDKYAMKAQSDDYYPDDYKQLKPKVSDENCGLRDCPKGSKKAPPEIRPVDDSKYCKNRKALKAQLEDDYVDDYKNLKPKVSDENCGLRDCPKGSKKAPPEIRPVDDFEYCHDDDCRLRNVNNASKSQQDRHFDDGKNNKQQISDETCDLKDCPKSSKQAQPEMCFVDNCKVLNETKAVKKCHADDCKHLKDSTSEADIYCGDNCKQFRDRSNLNAETEKCNIEKCQTQNDTSPTMQKHSDNPETPEKVGCCKRKKKKKPVGNTPAPAARQSSGENSGEARKQYKEAEPEPVRNYKPSPQTHVSPKKKKPVHHAHSSGSTKPAHKVAFCTITEPNLESAKNIDIDERASLVSEEMYVLVHDTSTQAEVIEVDDVLKTLGSVSFSDYPTTYYKNTSFDDISFDSPCHTPIDARPMHTVVHPFKNDAFIEATSYQPPLKLNENNPEVRRSKFTGTSILRKLKRLEIHSNVPTSVGTSSSAKKLELNSVLPKKDDTKLKAKHFDWKAIRHKRFMKNLSKGKQPTATEQRSQESSEGEMECKCSLSIGEIHKCEDDATPQSSRIFKGRFSKPPDVGLRIAGRHRNLFNKNLVSYYLSASSSIPDS